jgi:hypothetical protein
VIVTTNLPFEQWTEVLGSERLTGATLDRLTHRCHILEASGPSYRLQDATRRRGKGKSAPAKATAADKNEAEKRDKATVPQPVPLAASSLPSAPSAKSAKPVPPPEEEPV